MILKRLYELAEREKLLDDPAFEELPVPFIINVGPKGEYLGIEKRRGEVHIPSGKKNTPPKTRPDKGKVLQIPKAHGNTANPGFARFFVDTLARVLPVSEEAKSARSRTTFWQQVKQAATETKDPALQAILAFARQIQEDQQLSSKVRADVEAKKAAPGDRCSFAWHPDEGRTLVERKPVRDWYRQYFQSVTGERQKSGPQGICQITGELGPLPTSHAGRISGVPGGMSGGVSLVSYDKAAFESYGLDGAANAGVGYRASDGYLRALTSLVQDKLPGRPKTSLKIGNVLFLFWTRQPTGTADLMQLDRPEPDQVAKLIQSAERGQLSHSAEPNEFYCLALSGNSARAIVRDYLEEKLPKVQMNLGRWFRDLQIVDDSFEFQGQINCCYSLWTLSSTTARESDDVAPELPTQLMEAALKGNPVPDSVLAACLRRIRVESGSQKFRPVRMALIKLCLVRTHSQGENYMTEMLDTERSHGPAYTCGRLFSCLAYIQAFERDPRNHGYGQDAAMLSGYYGAASAAPRSVFGTLLRQTQHRLNKLREEYAAFVTNRSKELEQLTESMGNDFPAVLSLADQGRFALGFYHQRAAYRQRAAERKAITSEPESNE
jgi:CRISPR-associated protein Csd1